MRDDFDHFPPIFTSSDSGSLKPARSLVFLRLVSRDFFTSVIQLSNYLPFSLPYISHTLFHMTTKMSWGSDSLKRQENFLQPCLWEWGHVCKKQRAPLVSETFSECFGEECISQMTLVKSY